MPQPPVLLTTALQAVASGVHNVTLGELTESDSLLSPAATKSLTLGELTSTAALLSPAATKSATLGQLTSTAALLPLSATKSSALAELAEADSLLALAASKSATLGELASTAAMLSPAASKSRTLSELVEVDLLLPISGGVSGAINVNLGELVEVDLLLSLVSSTPTRTYHPRPGRVSVSSSATRAPTVVTGRTAATQGASGTDADVAPTGSDAMVSDGLTTADVS